jgi:hypothetical protein
MEIVDFKTSRSGPEEILQAEFQLAIYALGVEPGLKSPVSRTSVYFLGDGNYINWEWDESRKLKRQNELQDLLDRIRSGEFPAARSFCTKCDEFREICPYAK